MRTRLIRPHGLGWVLHPGYYIEDRIYKYLMPRAEEPYGIWPPRRWNPNPDGHLARLIVWLHL